MKYISTLIFGVALAYSWNLVQQVPAINVQTHAALQNRLADVIRQSVQEIKPAAKDIVIIKVTTEPIDEKTVKARFSYSFVEADEESGDLTQQQVDGEAVLKRSQGSDPDRDLWTMENVKTNTGAMTFKNGIVITPGGDDAENTEGAEGTDSANPESSVQGEGASGETPATETATPEVTPTPATGEVAPAHE